MVTITASFETYKKDLDEETQKQGLQLYDLDSEVINFLIFRERKKDENTLKRRIVDMFPGMPKGLIGVASSNYRYKRHSNENVGIIKVHDSSYLGALQNIAKAMEKKGYKMEMLV